MSKEILFDVAFAGNPMEHISLGLFFNSDTNRPDIITAEPVLAIFERQVKNNFSGLIRWFFRRRRLVVKK